MYNWVRPDPTPTDTRKLTVPYTISRYVLVMRLPLASDDDTQLSHASDRSIIAVCSGDTLDLYVEASELRFHMGHLEPFFCSAVLYDVSTGTQLSEAWHFDQNTPQLSQMLGNRLVRADESGGGAARLLLWC